MGRTGDNAQLASEILAKTKDRTRFLVDYWGWHWTDEIEAGLAAAGHPGLQPSFVPLAPDGRPILAVWMLPPEPAAPAAE